MQGIYIYVRVIMYRQPSLLHLFGGGGNEVCSVLADTGEPLTTLFPRARSLVTTCTATGSCGVQTDWLGRLYQPFCSILGDVPPILGLRMCCCGREGALVSSGVETAMPGIWLLPYSEGTYGLKEARSGALDVVDVGVW